MSTIQSDIEARLAASEPDVEVLLAEVGGGSTLRVFIDHPDGVTLGLCERVTHALMGIVYGAMLAHLAPELAASWSAPTELARSTLELPTTLRVTLGLMSAGVLVSGLRDLAAVAGHRRAAWPWRMEEVTS